MLSRLSAECASAFGPSAVKQHVDQYYGLEIARAQVDTLSALVPPRSEILDIGCGFGSFVIAASAAGFQAQGIEIADFQVDVARQRLGGALGGSIVHGSALELPFLSNSFDALTMWNLLEHVDDAALALREAARVIRPGGVLLAVAPNYASFRIEAHYRVPWVPLLPKPIAAIYLRALGRDPGFLISDIHYCTNVELIRTCETAGLKVETPDLDRLDRISAVRRPMLRHLLRLFQRMGMLRFARYGLRLKHRNPLRRMINITAYKPK